MLREANCLKGAALQNDYLIWNLQIAQKIFSHRIFSHNIFAIISSLWAVLVFLCRNLTQFYSIMGCDPRYLKHARTQHQLKLQSWLPGLPILPQANQNATVTFFKWVWWVYLLWKEECHRKGTKKGRKISRCAEYLIEKKWPKKIDFLPRKATEVRYNRGILNVCKETRWCFTWYNLEKWNKFLLQPLITDTISLSKTLKAQS